MFDIFGNGTIAPPVNWQPDPSTRGTTDILSTCLITLGLCLWSALHLNIPQHGKSSQQKWYKCGWLVLGLLAPEMIAYAAWVQLRAARRLDNRMKQLLGEAPSSSLRDKFWRFIRTGQNGRCRSTSGQDPEGGTFSEQHDEPQTGEENMRPRHLNVAAGDQHAGTASHETQSRTDESPVFMSPKSNSSKISFAGNRRQLVDEDRDRERRVCRCSSTCHQAKSDEVETELREEYGVPTHLQRKSAKPNTLPNGKPIAKKRRHPWTMTHSFYTVMGGFAFDTSDAKPNFLPNHRSRLCISVCGLEYIAEKAPELIPDIAEKHIKDKSKADSLAKFLVCLQALWFCVQCMTRVIQHKAISLLELNTFAHAFCALLIYALWWHKPQDVEEPTLLQGEKQWEMCAFLCMNSTKGDARPEARGGIAFGGHMIKSKFLRLMIYWPTDTATNPAPASDRIIIPETDSSSFEEGSYRRNPPGEGPAVMLKHGEFVYGFQCKYDYDSSNWKSAVRSHEKLRIESPHLRRLELYSNATKSFNIGHDYVNKAVVCDSMPNWPLTLILDESNLSQLRRYRASDIGDNPNTVLIGLIISGLLYGGLHLLAWEMPFASRAECILWRFSGIFIVSTRLGFTGLKGFIKAYDVCQSTSHSERILSLSEILVDAFMFLVPFALCLGYLLARTFLVVECFLQLFRLPASAYETPAWPAYFPHIS